MPYTEVGLPFAPGSQTSYKAAVSAASSRGHKTARYLRHLAQAGPQTDHESAIALNLPLSSINSIRNGAMHCELVERGSTERPSPYGKACSVWCLTSAGRVMVEASR